MTTWIGIVGMLLVFGIYEVWLLYHANKTRAAKEVLYWRNYNNYLENP